MLRLIIDLDLVHIKSIKWLILLWWQLQKNDKEIKIIISKVRIILLDFLDKYKNDNIKIGIYVTDNEYEKQSVVCRNLWNDYLWKQK